MRFEEKIFTIATSKTDYLRKIALKMLSLTMKTKFQIHVCDETVLQVVDENSKVQNAKSPLHNLQSGELGNIQEMDKKLKKKWGIVGSISLDDLKQHFGKKREEAAESLDVSVSTFKRICRENGILRWPSKKIKRDRVLLSNISSSETVPVANGPRISISTAPTAFASTNVLVNSNQQKSWSSNLSVDKEIGTSLNDHGDEENIMIQEGDSANREVVYKPQELEPACDGTSHLEKQYLGKERLSCNTEKEVIVSVEGSSSYDFRNVSEPNQGHLAVFASFWQVDKDQLISMDDLESDCINSQSTLESISEPSLQNDARRMKLNFDKLITLPLEDLTNPNHEASMKEALPILADNLSLFRDEQAKQLLEFQFDFPNITNSWRDCSQSRIDCQNFLAEFENTKSLLETSTKEEDDLKDKYTQLENKENEMMAQLEAIRKEKNEITKRRSEKFNQTKHLAALAEEQGGRTKDKELQMTIASNKLDNLKRQWVSVQSSFN
uniref:Nodule inception protein n=2 Tax=Solanum tuberosum TaxID=4113 RepID=M1CWG3_SOLTU